jgi:integrase
MATIAKNDRVISRLSAKEARQTYSIKGASGLHLVVHPPGKKHPSGRKVFYSVYQLGSGKTRKRVWIEIGEYSDHPDGWTLDKATDRNKDLQAKASTGIDPRAPTTFGELFTAWLDEHAKKQLRTWADEERRYNYQLRKALGKKLIADIERKDVREIRDDVAENSGPIESNRVVALFNRVMNWAVDEDRAKFNPAARLKKVGEEQRRERVLTPDEFKRLWHELDQPLVVDSRPKGQKHDPSRKGGLTETDLQAAVATRRAIKLLMLTGQRRGEVIGMAKGELDLADKDDAWWVIPKDRTKNGLPHRVPLTQLALDVLSEALEASGDSEYVFPSGKTEGAIRPDAVTKQLQRTCRKMAPKIEGLGPHDIRRTIGTTLRKMGVSVEDRSYVFNHISGAKAKVTSWNYDAGEHDDEKRRALQLWQLELKRIVGLAPADNVRPMRRVV